MAQSWSVSRNKFNLFFAVSLFTLQKLLEADFFCPCIQIWNIFLSLFFFVIPGLLLCFLFVKKLECTCYRALKTLFPALAWLTLLLLDGKYFSCILTNWEGEYVPMDTNTMQMWCKPHDTNKTSNEEKMNKTIKYYAWSQTSAFFSLVLIMVGVLIWKKRECCKDKNQSDTSEMGPLTDKQKVEETIVNIINSLNEKYTQQ